MPPKTQGLKARPTLCAPSSANTESNTTNAPCEIDPLHVGLKPQDPPIRALSCRQRDKRQRRAAILAWGNAPGKHAPQNPRAEGPTYRKVDWYFAVYEGIELIVLYKVPAKALEPYFSAWEKKWKESGGKDINNPKITLKFVESVGTVIHETKSVAAVVPVAPTLNVKVKDIEEPE